MAPPFAKSRTTTTSSSATTTATTNNLRVAPFRAPPPFVREVGASLGSVNFLPQRRSTSISLSASGVSGAGVGAAAGVPGTASRPFRSLVCGVAASVPGSPEDEFDMTVVDAESKQVGLTDAEATVNVVKAVMGAGGFALPWAFAQGGTLLTSCLLIVACIGSLYTLEVMIRAKNLSFELNPALKPKDMSTYAEIAVETLGKAWGRLAEVLILSCCLGVCSAYLVFIASTLQTIIGFDQSILMYAITPVLILLSWLREMSGVSLISILGTISVTLGMIFVSWYALQQPISFAAVPVSAPTAFPKFFGSVAFLYFIHYTLPTVQHSMAKPEKFLSASANAFGICAIGCTLFGILGAVSFGPEVHSVVVTMLGNGLLAIAVKLLLCVNLLCTFPIIVRSAFLIVEGWFEAGTGKSLELFQSRSLRTSFVLFAVLLSTCIPSFGALLGYVGGISLTSITIIFPCLMLLNVDKSLTMMKKPSTIGSLERALLYSFIVGGVLIAVMSVMF